MAPPIPPELAHLPTTGGLAAPYITARHRDGTPVFGINDPQRVAECLALRRCNICGKPLAHRDDDQLAVLFTHHAMITGLVAEPALHPHVCAPYAAAACPVLSGQVTRYRATPIRMRCCDPACECRFWDGDGFGPHGPAAPAPTLYCGRIRAGDYAVADHPGRPGQLMLNIDPDTVRDIRLVVPGHPDETTRLIIRLLGLPLPAAAEETR